MRNLSIIVASVLIATSAFAQQAQRSSSPQGVQIQGNTEIKASAENSTATAKGENTTAKNTVGAIKGGTQIQGNTKIQASSKNATAKAEGKNTTAANEVGVIGGK